VPCLQPIEDECVQLAEAQACGTGIAFLPGESEASSRPAAGCAPEREMAMDTNLLLLIVVLILLFGGGGFYWSRRR
jgi:hypothetical protein